LANGRAVPEMLSLWLRPWALSVDHDFDPGDHLAASIAGLAFLAALVAGALALRRRAPLVSFAILWTLLCLAPTNSLLAKLDLVTEKPLYLAWLGPSMLLGRAAEIFAEKFRPRLAAVATALVLSLGGFWCVRRAAVWRDALELWLDATAKAPRNA